MLTMSYMLMYPESEPEHEPELVRAALNEPPHEGGFMTRISVYTPKPWKIDKVFGEPETAMLNEAVKRNGWEAVAKAFATDGLAAVLT